MCCFHILPLRAIPSPCRHGHLSIVRIGPKTQSILGRNNGGETAGDAPRRSVLTRFSDKGQPGGRIVLLGPAVVVWTGEFMHTGGNGN